MSGTGNSSNELAPFTVRGSTSAFAQRQKSAFDCLQALEEAHLKVTKETRAERNLVKKLAWRPAKPAVESLEAEKEAVCNFSVFNLKSLVFCRYRYICTPFVRNILE